MVSVINFKDLLSGEQAFYNKRDYIEKTRQDFSSKTCIPTTYKYEIEKKVIRVIKAILTILILPLSIYKLIHYLGGKQIVLTSTKNIYGDTNPHATRQKISLENNPWKFKRITVEVDGYKIDAMIMGQASTLSNGKWLLYSNGNDKFYEDLVVDCDKESCELTQLLGKLHSNAIIFNYPGVGASAGGPNRKTMEKAYRAMLTFLEDQERGVGAKEIIGYGYSLGGGVQGDALRHHQLKKEIKYVFVKNRTFSNLQKAASERNHKMLGILIKLFGWNISSVQSSKTLQVPEIILQTARVTTCAELNDNSLIIDDTAIPDKSSLAKVLLNDPSCPKDNKVFLGIPETHYAPLGDTSTTYLAQKIEELLVAST